MGLFDTIRCDYPLPDPTLQDAEFQTKSLSCALERYTITADGRLLRHPGGGLFDEPAEPTERDIEIVIHGDIEMHQSWRQSLEDEWVEYAVRFTHGRVEWIRPWTPPGGEAPAPRPGPHTRRGLPHPDVMGRILTAAEFSACAPEKLELLDGHIPGGRGLLLLLLTSFGLRRTAALVGYDLWRRTLPDTPASEARESEG